MLGFGSRAVAKAHEAEAERRYRSVIPLTGGSIGAFGFFVLGIGMVIHGIRADIGATVVGAFVVAIAGMLAALVKTTYADLTPTGLAYRYNFAARQSRGIPSNHSVLLGARAQVRGQAL